MLPFAASPALANLSAEIELKSDDRFHGRSLSDGRPVIEADISIDSDSGVPDRRKTRRVKGRRWLFRLCDANR
jgi:hypothetical protein